MYSVQVFCILISFSLVYSQVTNCASMLDQMVMNVLSGMPVQQVTKCAGPKQAELVNILNKWVSQLNAGKPEILKPPPPKYQEKTMISPPMSQLSLLPPGLQTPTHFNPPEIAMSAPQPHAIDHEHTEPQISHSPTHNQNPPEHVAPEPPSPNQEVPSDLASLLSMTNIDPEQISKKLPNPHPTPSPQEIQKMALEALNEAHQRNVQQLLKSSNMPMQAFASQPPRVHTIDFSTQGHQQPLTEAKSPIPNVAQKHQMLAKSHPVEVENPQEESVANIEQTVMKAFPEDFAVKTLPMGQSDSSFDITSFLKSVQNTFTDKSSAHTIHQLNGQDIAAKPVAPKLNTASFRIAPAINAPKQDHKFSIPAETPSSLMQQPALTLDPMILQHLGLHNMRS